MENNNDLEFRKIFGKRLKELRLKNKLQLKELSADLLLKLDVEISYGSLANYERAFRVPTLYLLSKIAEYFNVSTDYLMGISDIENAIVLQTSVFDENNKEQTLRIGIDKDSDLSKMTIEEIKDIRELVDKLEKLGINMDNK